MNRDELDKRLRKSIRTFWRTRGRQGEKQGSTSGVRDTGKRAEVTGGKHLDGFVHLCRDILIEAGIPSPDVAWRGRKTLPGFYRAEKDWDIVACSEGQVVAVIEFKAQVGSFGNNCNNRIEEAVGSATDLWAAYRDGTLKPSQRPWLGYVFLLEDCEKSRSPIRLNETFYPVLAEFRDASYAMRYEIMMEKLLRERLYDGACLILSPSSARTRGGFRFPSEEISFYRFASSLSAHASAFANLGK